MEIDRKTREPLFIYNVFFMLCVCVCVCVCGFIICRWNGCVVVSEQKIKKKFKKKK